MTSNKGLSFKVSRIQFLSSGVFSSFIQVAGPPPGGQVEEKHRVPRERDPHSTVPRLRPVVVDPNFQEITKNRNLREIFLPAMGQKTWEKTEKLNFNFLS